MPSASKTKRERRRAVLTIRVGSGQHFSAAIKAARMLRIRFHDMRHTAATPLLGKGVHPKAVSEMLGYSTIGLTLDTYSHLLPAMHQQAASTMDAILAG